MNIPAKKPHEIITTPKVAKKNISMEKPPTTPRTPEPVKPKLKDLSTLDSDEESEFIPTSVSYDSEFEGGNTETKVTSTTTKKPKKVTKGKDWIYVSYPKTFVDKYENVGGDDVIIVVNAEGNKCKIAVYQNETMKRHGLLYWKFFEKTKLFHSHESSKEEVKKILKRVEESEESEKYTPEIKNKLLSLLTTVLGSKTKQEYEKFTPKDDTVQTKGTDPKKSKKRVKEEQSGKQQKKIAKSGDVDVVIEIDAPTEYMDTVNKPFIDHTIDSFRLVLTDAIQRAPMDNLKDYYDHIGTTLRSVFPI